MNAPMPVLIDVEALRRSLPEIGAGLCAQLEELSARPSPHAAERVAANLAGARATILRLREEWLREGTGDATCTR